MAVPSPVPGAVRVREKSGYMRQCSMMVVMIRTPQLDGLGLNPGFAAYWPGDLEQVTQLL